ncbi:MAG: pantetheine-phosphate adenylyltransferase [Planctomycetota bacterium]
MTKRVLFPGSFDPCTLGHLDLIQRACRQFDEVVVAVGVNVEKKTLFGGDERVELLEAMVAGLMGVRVVQFSGLTVRCAERESCQAILRGVRNATDFEYELQMGLTNRVLAPDLETICLFPDQRFTHLSSRLIREVYRFGGETLEFLAPAVSARMKEKFRVD